MSNKNLGKKKFSELRKSQEIGSNYNRIQGKLTDRAIDNVTELAIGRALISELPVACWANSGNTPKTETNQVPIFLGSQ